MFALTPDHLSGPILDCAAGPASFNAELSAEGHKVISCDPLYRSTTREIRLRVEAAHDTIVANLRMARHEFGIALCSHFLLTYSDQFSTDFHVSAIEELCRVADQARVFPLLKSYGGPSPHLDPTVDALRGRGYRVEIRRVPYEFQRGGDEMLVASRG